MQTATNYDIKADQKLKICYAEGLAYEKKGSADAISKFQTSLELIGDKRDNDLYLSALYHLATNQFKHKKFTEALRDVNKIIEAGCVDKCVY